MRVCPSIAALGMLLAWLMLLGSCGGTRQDIAAQCPPEAGCDDAAVFGPTPPPNGQDAGREPEGPKPKPEQPPEPMPEPEPRHPDREQDAGKPEPAPPSPTFGFCPPRLTIGWPCPAEAVCQFDDLLCTCVEGLWTCRSPGCPETQPTPFTPCPGRDAFCSYDQTLCVCRRGGWDCAG